MQATPEAAETVVTLTHVQIFVKTVEGRSIAIEVAPSDTVAQVKNRIQDKEGIPSEHQRLLFGGKPLPDDHMVADCDVQMGSTLHLQVIGQPKPVGEVESSHENEKARSDSTQQREDEV